MTPEIEAHRAALMAPGQVFTYGDVVRLKRPFGSYKIGDLLTVKESALQQQHKIDSSPDDPMCRNYDSFLNSYSLVGIYGGVAWFDLDDIERA